MAVLRKAHKSNFTVIDNQVFKSNLSLKARGLLSTMLSLPDNWNFSTAGLTSILPSDGESVIPLRHQGVGVRRLPDPRAHPR